MVVSGTRQGGKKTKKTELIWTARPNSKCALEDFPLEVSGAAAFQSDDGPVICGGRHGRNRENIHSNQCFLFNFTQQWISWADMTTARSFISAIQFNDHQNLIIGGSSYPIVRRLSTMLDTSELVNSNGAEVSESLPTTIYGYCTLKINATVGLIIGGNQNDGDVKSAATWYVEWPNLKFTPGPRMQTKRRYPGCSIFHLGNKTYGIVSGGTDYWELDTSETIDFRQNDPTWTKGKRA